MNKKCNTCGQFKPLMDFYINYRLRDGYVKRCKECERKRQQFFRDNSAEYYINYRDHKKRLYDERTRNGEIAKINRRLCP